MNCGCNSEMTVRQMNDAEIDVCESCHAIFFDPGELHTALNLKSKAPERQIIQAAALAPKSGTPCPRCSSEMHRVDTKKTSVNACAACGGVLLSRLAINVVLAETAAGNHALAALAVQEHSPSKKATFDAGIPVDDLTTDAAFEFTDEAFEFDADPVVDTLLDTAGFLVVSLFFEAIFEALGEALMDSLL